jgi:glycine/D-amino acid oxidase-like deaminating enzyme
MPGSCCSTNASILVSSMSNQTQLRVAVIGGGAIGVSSAYHLARRGAKVWLVTEGALASGASGRSLSWLNSAAVYSEHYHQLRMLGIDRYRTLFTRQPDCNWLRFDGGLTWQPLDKLDLQSALHAHQFAHGYDSQLLSPHDVERRLPGVNPAVIPSSGAMWNPGEGWVDLPSLISYLAKDLVEAGGELITNAGEASVSTDAGRVTEIRTEMHGAIQVDAVLLATGWKAPQMAAQFGATIPDATPMALLVKTHPVQTQLRVVLNTPRASVRPTPDGALAVDSDWTTPYIDVQPDGTANVPAEITEQLLAEASRLISGKPLLTAATSGIGPKPVPADGEPVLGQIGKTSGLYVAFTHSGATLALIVGELLASEITTGQPHPLLAPFTARRFT